MCDMVPMLAGHILLGRLWQYDWRVTHDGDKNQYSFVKYGRNITLVPLSPKQVFEDQMKMVIGKEKSENEKESETKEKNERKEKSENEKESETKEKTEIKKRVNKIKLVTQRVIKKLRENQQEKEREIEKFETKEQRKNKCLHKSE